MQNDSELISRILFGDVRAFKVLVSQHEKIVVSMISRIVARQEDVEDVCQEVFIKVHNSLRLFKFQSQLSTWIARIAYTTAINHRKKTSANARRTADVDDVEALEFRHREDQDPETLLLKKDTSAFIQAEIMKLPDHYRTVLTLYHLNEFSYNEIEEITGMPEGTVKNYLFRARKLLKENLGNYMN